MKPSHGFTLIELAIVLVIVTLLIGGLAVPLSAQIQARRVAETNRTLEEAREAIIGYAMSHTVASSCTCAYTAGTLDGPGSTCPVSLCPATAPTALTLPIARHYLPCPDKPDDGNAGTTDDGDGREDRNGNACASAVGYFPWVTLGTGQQDAWGNRLAYAVSGDLSDKSTGVSRTANGEIQVCSNSGNESDTDCGTPGDPGNEPDVAQDIAAVILSHGANGRGALNASRKVLAAPTDNNELENLNADLEFVSRGPSTDDFDDLVKWLSIGQLKGRVCPPGGCP